MSIDGVLDDGNQFPGAFMISYITVNLQTWKETKYMHTPVFLNSYKNVLWVEDGGKEREV
jgi:hypothetical protein